MLLALAVMEAASSCGGVRHKKIQRPEDSKAGKSS
jgi:hypothetical protein